MKIRQINLFSLYEKGYNIYENVLEKRGMHIEKNVCLATEYITFGQFLKEINVIGSGGQAKWYLADNSVFVDGELENRRGRKLYVGHDD